MSAARDDDQERLHNGRRTAESWSPPTMRNSGGWPMSRYDPSLGASPSRPQVFRWRRIGASSATSDQAPSPLYSFSYCTHAPLASLLRCDCRRFTSPRCCRNRFADRSDGTTAARGRTPHPPARHEALCVKHKKHKRLTPPTMLVTFQPQTRMERDDYWLASQTVRSLPAQGARARIKRPHRPPRLNAEPHPLPRRSFTLEINTVSN